MSYVSVSHHDRVALITLNDPDRRNALNLDLNAELIDAVADIEANENLGAVVVTGTPPAFCAGADLSQLGASQEEGLKKIYAGFLAIADCSLPTIAAVNGAAVGAGMNLALACDVRIAGARARFDTRFLDLGIHPGGGHTWMMSRIVGVQSTAAMVLFGQVLDGADAARVGLAWECVADDELIERSIAVAARAAAGPRDLAIAIKKTIRDVQSIDSHADAVARELTPQVWSINQPAFADKLAALQRKISSNG
ncbi:MAG: enoyl-CoA hydratase [Actinobacteria bacterium]|nr:enoyl-CoA hydratase [Actinomycetota bacterium]